MKSSRSRNDDDDDDNDDDKRRRRRTTHLLPCTDPSLRPFFSSSSTPIHVPGAKDVLLRSRPSAPQIARGCVQACVRACVRACAFIVISVRYVHRVTWTVRACVGACVFEACVWGGLRIGFLRCVRACVRACVRVRVRACVRACANQVCVFASFSRTL